ncbi:MAG: triose-phosphate isomerase family protein, partial [Burkholderiaceae bacterium]
MQRVPLVLGNWKMNGSVQANEALLQGLLGSLSPQADAAIKQGDLQAGVAVPAPYLFQAATRLRSTGLLWGAQDCSNEIAGAFTGEISADMLKDFDCQFALVGHSERRERAAESSDLVGRKLGQLLNNGLMPVVCVGEPLSERDTLYLAEFNLPTLIERFNLACMSGDRCEALYTGQGLAGKIAANEPLTG